MAETNIRQLVNQGKVFFKNQAFKKAENILLKVVQSKHEYADVYNILGLINHQNGQSSKAIGFFEKALGINSNYTEAMLNLSVLYNDLGEYKKSRALLDKSKKEIKKSGDLIDPFVRGKLANKHAETGDVYRGIGLFKYAIAEFEKALHFAPNFHDIRSRLGVCLREDNRKNDALKEFQVIVKAKPAFTEAKIQLGITYYSMGQKNEARKVWTEIIKTSPNNELAKMYLRLSDPANQVSGVKKVAANTNKSVAVVKKAKPSKKVAKVKKPSKPAKKNKK